MISWLWRVVGSSPGGNPVRVHIRADDYFEARAKGRKMRIRIRDIVLIEEPGHLDLSGRAPYISGQ